MPRPAARHTFKNRSKLMELLNIGDQSSDMRKMLRDAGHRTPKARHIDRICYHSQLMSSGMARTMLLGLSSYARSKNIAIDEDVFKPSVALIEFDSMLVGFGHVLSKAIQGKNNTETDYIGDIANAAGTTPEIVQGMASGKCILVPYDFANSIAIEASQRLEFSRPFEVKRCPSNESWLKPLGGTNLEYGKQAHQCAETNALRQGVLSWLNKPNK